VKISNRIFIGSLVLMILFIGLVFVASASDDDLTVVSSECEVSGIDESEDIKPLDFGPQTLEDLKKDSNVVAIKGQIPTYDIQAERQNWLHKLDQSRLIVRNDMESYVYPKGPVICYGWNVNGYFNVVLYEGINVTDSQLNEIYDMINKDANKASIQEIPVVFNKRDFFKNATAASGYANTYHNPVIGAISLLVKPVQLEH
jgi:hypothetical protein